LLGRTKALPFFGQNADAVSYSIVTEQGKRIWIPIQGERSTTAYISFQPTETCA